VLLVWYLEFEVGGLVEDLFFYCGEADGDCAVELGLGSEAAGAEHGLGELMALD